MKNNVFFRYSFTKLLHLYLLYLKAAIFWGSRTLVYVFVLCAYTFSYAVVNESATEATAPCLDRLSCADSDSSLSSLSSLSRLVESISENPCPKFIIEQQILRDSKSSLTTDSPDEICSTGAANSMNHFKNASELESYLRQSPHFSDLNQASPPFSPEFALSG